MRSFAFSKYLNHTPGTFYAQPYYTLYIMQCIVRRKYVFDRVFFLLLLVYHFNNTIMVSRLGAGLVRKACLRVVVWRPPVRWNELNASIIAKTYLQVPT